jgi:hypothetical protein
MHVNTTPSTQLVTTRPVRPRLWTGAAGAGVVASAATTVVASLAHTLGVSLDVGGDPVPLPGFATMTLLFSAVGLVIAAGFQRWNADPRRTWVRTAVALTACSFIPDLLADAAVSTRLTLMLTHVVAASIVIPVIAGRLAPR